MSRIGKQLIKVPAGVDVSLQENTVRVKGPKGELKFPVPTGIVVKIADQTVQIKRIGGQDKMAKSLHGLARAQIQNMVKGVSAGFERKLEIIGVGYRAAGGGKKLTLSLGYSHPIEFSAPECVSMEIDKEKKNLLIISGIDRQRVGETAAQLRGFRPPEPYKGKGIKYVEEHIVRKAGKTAGS